MEDPKIIYLLKSNHQKAFMRLYKYLPMVKSFILKHGGSKEDAHDIFQEALIIFYRNLQQKEFRLTAKVSTYLYSICKYLWKDELKKLNKQSNIDWQTDLDENDPGELQEMIEKEKKISQAELIIASLSKRCRQILTDFYYRSLKMKEIARNMGLKSEKIAKNEKYKCLEKAKSKIDHGQVSI